jgi:hypothetical protein
VLFGICGLTTFVHACECAALLTGCRGFWEKHIKKRSDLSFSRSLAALMQRTPTGMPPRSLPLLFPVVQSYVYPAPHGRRSLAP